MTTIVLGAAPPMDRMQGIRDRFAGGGSASAFFEVLLLLAMGLFLLYLGTVLVQRYRQHRTNDPRRLFHEVLRCLPVNVPQRDLLRRMARELRLDHPTVLVLSPRLLRTHANRWMSAERRANETTRQRLDELSRALFPDSDESS